jgi:hypothetical protein
MILIKFKDTVAPAVIIFLFCAHFSGVKTQDIQKWGGGYREQNASRNSSWTLFFVLMFKSSKNPPKKYKYLL